MRAWRCGIGILALVLVCAPARADEPAPWLGISFSPAGLTGGPRIVEVHHDTPASEAGLRVDDEIVEIDGVALGPGVALPSLVGRRAVGDEIELVVWRGGQVTRVRATLAARRTDTELLAAKLVGAAAPATTLRAVGGGPATTPAAAGQVTVMAWFGLRCASCSAALADVAERARSWSARSVRVFAATSATDEEVARWRTLGGAALPVRVDTSTPSALTRYTIDGGRASVSLVVIDGAGIVRHATVLDTPHALEDAALVVERWVRDLAGRR